MAAPGNYTLDHFADAGKTVSRYTRERERALRRAKAGRAAQESEGCSAR